jgi:hypothetical protein
MNPNKCAFGISAGQFLGFLIHERGIDVGQKSISVIDKIEVPSNKELQSLIGKINFIRRFISNLSERIQLFTPLLKLNDDQKFVVWGEEQHKALDNIKQYLKSLPVLMHPQDKKLFKLYLSASERAIGSEEKKKSESYIS